MEQPLRIIQLMAGGARGGAETAYVDMCIAMHEEGQHILAVTRPNDIRVPRLRDAGIKVHTLPFGGKLDLYTAWRLRHIIRAFKPHIVQTWMSRAAAKAPAWRQSSGLPRYYIVSRLGSYYKLKYYQNTDYFVTITPDIARYLIAHGTEASRVRHINNFAEVEQAQAPIDRATYGTPADAMLLLGLGRLHEAKAFDTMIKAVAALPGVYLWIAGEGPQRAELEALIARLNVADRVKLLGWQTDRAALFKACDICCFTSRKEGFGTVFVQSWAQKTPVIVSDADGPRQFVRDGEDGLVVPVDDEAALRHAIERLAADPALQQTLVENGYRRYQNEFTRKKSLAAYLDYYREIIAADAG